MKILVTGADGFIGKNIKAYIDNQDGFSYLAYTKNNSSEDLSSLVLQSDAIIHLAGENRPKNTSDFETTNLGLSQKLCDAIVKSNKKIPLIFASSTQALEHNPYGESKLLAEKVFETLSLNYSVPICIFRLPNVFGKWCRPNYNSVVATFCYNVANNIPIKIHNPKTLLNLVHIDDVINNFFAAFERSFKGFNHLKISSEYSINIADLANKIYLFRDSRSSLLIDDVGSGLTRLLYSTYISYLSPDQFAYDLTSYKDERGLFAEVLKTKNSGQFSFFTSDPGITRGEHYHNIKTEKFIVIKGYARFKFKNISTNQTYELNASEDRMQIIDIAPGWSHNITNVGNGQLVVMLWANEIFDRNIPDTIGFEV